MTKTTPQSKTATKTTKLRKRKADDPAQYERFREFAKAHGADENDEAFLRAFAKIVGVSKAQTKK
jgi:hypothetical protein